MTNRACGLISLVLLIALTGCSANAERYTEVEPAQETRADKQVALNIPHTFPVRTRPAARTAPAPDIWQLTRSNMKLPIDADDSRLKDQLDWLRKNPEHLELISENAKPYYFYVLDQVLERGLPAELALLPMIESGYDPFAHSPGAAAGPWQFIPGTARHFGLTSNAWYDGRRDLIESTEAALTYLEQLHKQFEGDWLLALAAYNAGAGTVSRAIRHNREHNLPEDYWSLSLPAETMRHVPKLLAAALMIRDARVYDLKLAHIPAKPYFAEVETDGQIDMSLVAQLADIDLEELQRLNPGFSRKLTAPNGPHRLLAPIESAESMQQAVESLQSEHSEVQHELLAQAVEAGDLEVMTYQIRPGDSLWVIANRFNVSVDDLTRWNRINLNTVLHPGQQLALYLAQSDGTS
ncbi:transglycosylase SLT domain-containing protein [Nitrincola alkalilacustris]|uniref:transglycosylase SLT domain-containing protein n=1 Tax=Nitrincola alkalilacustris TaxID=1571224 RepID=UPI00124EAC28|nr:transglycosylase SLT domain-containing protein [Nitrincola alkalilacustris]